MTNYQGFIIVPMDEQQTKFAIVVGNQRGTGKEFDSIEAAEKYIDEKPWELIGALAYAISDNLISINKLEEEAKV